MKRTSVVSLAAVSLLLVASAAAQQPLTVTISAVDKKGEPVENLTATDIRAKVNGKPAAVTEFAPREDAGRDVVLLVDSSNSTQFTFAAQLQAAYQLGVAFLPREHDTLEVIAFDEVFEPRGTVRTEAELRAALQLRPGGGTALWDAVVFATMQLAKQPSSAVPRRRIVVLVSDGERNMGVATREDALRAAQKTGTVVYGLYGEAIHESSGTAALTTFARQTGGEAFFPVGDKELARSVQRLRLMAEVSYTVKLDPSAPAKKGRYKLDLDGPKNVRLHYPEHIHEVAP